MEVRQQVRGDRLAGDPVAREPGQTRTEDLVVYRRVELLVDGQRVGHHYATGVHTLATQFWAYQTDASYGAAAPYAVVMVALAALPGYALIRWFDRQPGEQRA